MATSSRGGSPRPVPTSTTLFTHISQLVTQNDALGDIPEAAMLVKGNVIAWVGPMAQLPEEAAAAAATVSLAGCVVIPGLVNTHHHTYQTLTRCIAQVIHSPVVFLSSKNWG